MQSPQDCDDVLLTDTFLRSSREAILSSMGVGRTNDSAFSVKFLNVLDPLKEDNNLGRSVCKGIAMLKTSMLIFFRYSPVSSPIICIIL